MLVVHSSDIADRGVARLHDRFKLPKWQGVLRSLLNAVQKIEDATAELKAGMVLGDAIGVQLEMLGAIVGQGRSSTDNAIYRLAIKARGLVNASQGLPDDLLALGDLLFPVGSAWSYEEKWPNTIMIFFHDDWATNFTATPRSLALWFLAARVAGKELHFVSNGNGAASTITYSYVGAASDDPDKGYSSVGVPSVGGYSAHVLKL